MSEQQAAETFYDAVGGHETFRKLVARFYEGVAGDPVLRAMYPEEDLGPAEVRFRMFLEQYWGGPRTYSEERGHPRLRMRHAPFAVTEAARDRWLGHMRMAVDELELEPMYEQELWAYLVMAANSMVNTLDDPRQNLLGWSPPLMTYDANWWRNAVIYQIYIRSFADGNGDGVGDIAGIRSRLPYLRDLGVDAIWITPWYPSPMADGGYDVADYRDIAPEFGTLDEASALLEEAHEHGLKVILDIVPNHTSDEHEWFRQALEAGPGDPERERYWFRDGRGPDGALPPNDWFSVFGGPAWTRLLDEEGVPEQWYLHLFAPEQPDLKWTNQEVRTEFEDVLRFWFDRGVDGFRIDVAHGLMKHPALPDLGLSMEELLAAPPADHPAWDRPDVHEIYREWRKVADSYEDPRVFVAEAWVHTGSDRLAAYLRPDELHQAFNFDFLRCHWEAQQLRTSIDHSLETLADVGAPTSWVMSNHDIYRHVTRFGRPPLSSLANRGAYEQLPVDVALGTRRARAAALLMLGLPGSAYVYQGEELGLPDVTDLPEDTLQDPIWERSGNTVRGRDGCRVPLPWSGTSPPFGFGSGDGAEPWLPQPAEWISLTAEAQAEAADSMLSLYRDALRIRREQLAGQPEALTWNKDAPDAVLSFNRGDALRVVVNLGEVPVALPQHVAVALASGPLPHDTLPPDTAAWLQVR